MSLRWLAFAFVLAACGAPQNASSKDSDDGEPKTAKEKQLREAKANGELDDPSTAWGSKWQYQGDRNDCIYMFDQTCFKTQKAACRAAKCAGKTKCTPSGGGPITLTCK